MIDTEELEQKELVGSFANAMAVVARAVHEATNDLGVALDARTVCLLMRAGLPAAAAHAGLSERTLRRRLKSHGSSVSDLLTAVRKRAFVDLVEAGVVDEWIATALGYSDGRSLNRFIRSAFGSTLQVVKRAIRQGSGPRQATSKVSAKGRAAW